MLAKFFVAIVAFASVVAAARPKWQDLGNYTFEKYMTDFNLKFPPAEIESRRATFLSELSRVNTHNAKNHAWKEGMNKFSVLSAAEKKAYHGRSKGAAHRQKDMLKNAHPLPADFKMQPVSALPKSVDWRTKGEFPSSSIDLLSMR